MYWLLTKIQDCCNNETDVSIGYADSTGEASEKNMVEDSVAVFYWVKAHSGSSPIFIWGHSLGSG